MCPPADQTNGVTKDEMVPIDNSNTPHIPPPTNETNGKSEPPPVKSHKGVYGRASDFLSNTSNWKVSGKFGDLWRGMWEILARGGARFMALRS